MLLCMEKYRERMSSHGSLHNRHHRLGKNYYLVMTPTEPQTLVNLSVVKTLSSENFLDLTLDNKSKKNAFKQGRVSYAYFSTH